MDATGGNLISTLIWAVQQFTTTQYCQIALFTFFMADYFHTVTTEIDFLWPAPWTAVKTVFFVSRYTPFLEAGLFIFFTTATNPSVEVCEKTLKTEIWSSGVGQMSAQILFIFRAYALLGQTRLSGILLSLFAVIVLASFLTCVISLHIHTTVIPSLLPGVLPGCLESLSSTAADAYGIAGIIAGIVYESILFMVIYFAKRLKYKEDQSRLMKKIYNDALIYYLSSLVIYIFGIILWFSAAGPTRELSPDVPRILQSILSCRIVLSIRKYGREGNLILSRRNALGTVGGQIQTPSRFCFAPPTGPEVEIEP